MLNTEQSLSYQKITSTDEIRRWDEGITSSSDANQYFRFVKPALQSRLGFIGIDVTFSRAQGDHLYYTDSRGHEIEVLDLVGGFGACLLGHNHPEIIQTITERISSGQPVLVQGSNQAEAGTLAARLSGILTSVTGKSYVCVFGNSGAEAVDIAMKHSELERAGKTEAMAKKLSHELSAVRDTLENGHCHFDQDEFLRLETSAPGTPVCSGEDALRIVENNNARILSRPPLYLAVQKSFHGKTVGALSLTYNAEYRKPFSRLLQKTHFLDPHDSDEIWNILRTSCENCCGVTVDERGVMRFNRQPVSNIAAVILEPIQGEGGINTVPHSFVEACRKLCDYLDIPLIFDEIQSGLGRSGRFFASEHLGIPADIYLLSKSLGGGMAKISATLIDRDRYQDEFSLLHSSTFADDPLTSAIGNKVLDIVERDHLDEVAGEKGSYFKKRLEELAKAFPEAIREIRGRGLMLGIVLSEQLKSTSPIIREIEKSGQLAYFACGYLFNRGNIRILPTLSDPHVLRIEPSAYITYADIEKVVDAVQRLCETLKESNARHFLGFVANGSAVSEKQERNRSAAVSQSPCAAAARNVGFLVHFVDEKQLQALEPSFASASADEQDRFIRALAPVAAPIRLGSTAITSARGNKINFHLVAVPITSRMMAESLRDEELSPGLPMVKDAVRMAREIGCEIVGLGQYTSIVSKNGTAICEPGLTITTGNSLTVAMTIRAIIKATTMRKIDPSQARLSIVGATGNIGSIYATMIAEQFSHINLVGSPRQDSRERLAILRADIIRGTYRKLSQEGAHDGGFKGVAGRLWDIPLIKKLVTVGTDIDTALSLIAKAGIDEELIAIHTDLSAIRDSNVIVSVVNSAGIVLRSEHVGENAILCDVSVPCSTEGEIIKNRKDVLFFTGGIVQLPGNGRIEEPAFTLPPGHVFACMAETMLLGLSGIMENLSYGKLNVGNIQLIDSLAGHHGFTLGPLKRDIHFGRNGAAVRHTGCGMDSLSNNNRQDISTI